jgi:hypothetical protein
VESKDWRIVRVARSADRFRITVDGRDLLEGKADAMPRFRVAFVLEGDLVGELAVRNLKLMVPEPATDVE